MVCAIETVIWIVISCVFGGLAVDNFRLLRRFSRMGKGGQLRPQMTALNEYGRVVFVDSNINEIISIFSSGFKKLAIASLIACVASLFAAATSLF
jgi:hypothetical protein